MFFNIPLIGNKLPDKTLCITYDDGPGPNTLPLAQFLADKNIPATFFVLGERARSSPEILPALQALGHLVANHTANHPNLMTIADTPAAYVNQIVETDEFLKAQLGLEFTLFRPPYGAWWHDGKWESPIGKVLNGEKVLERCVGPIMWDIDGSDWRYWRDRETPEDCAHHYLELIERIGRGIVLMHDSSWEPEIMEGNRSLELNHILIPELVARGYQFVRLDAVPQVASAMQVTRRVAFQTPDGNYFLSIKNDDEVYENASSIGAGEEFGLVELGESRVAVRAPNGHFVSVPALENAKALADATSMGAEAVFKLLMLENGLIALETHDNQHFLSLQNEDGHVILANKSRTDARNTFSLIGL